MKILILEANTRMRRLIKSLFAEPDLEWIEGADGGEALSAYVQHRPDWVLMDIALPRMDGLAATCQIIARFPEARIVILTQDDEVALRAAAEQAGACGYLSKENLSEVPRWIAAHHASDPIPPCRPTPDEP